MRVRVTCLMLGWGLLFFQTPTAGFAQQTRDDKVRSDRETLKDDDSWNYDDLEQGFEVARRDRKPVMAVLRCIP